MYRISKMFEFSASHQLYGLPPEHQCSRLHGHNYSVELTLDSAGLNATSFVRDYGELSAFKVFLDTEVEHRHLNEVFADAVPGGQTSAENLAWYFYGWCKSRWPEIVAVTVKETPKTAATYSE